MATAAAVKGKQRDTILSPAFEHLSGQGRDQRPSSIFKGEGANRLSSLFAGADGGMPTVSGVKGFGRTHGVLPTGDLNGSFSMPSLGEGWWDATADTKVLAGMAVQASQRGAAFDPGAGHQVRGAFGNTSFVQPFFHTPGNAQDAFNLPKSYIEQIRWSRLMYNLNAYIGAITDLKAYYGLSMFKLNTPEPFVSEFYEEESFNKDFNLYEFDLRMSLGMQKFGEAIAWGSRIQKGTWPKTGKPIWGWSHFIMLESELVEIKRDFFGGPKPRFYLRPSKDLEDLVRKMDDNDPEVAHYRDRIAEPIKQRIRQRELVPLDSSTVSAIQNLTDASATRGTPPYQRLFVTFVYEDFVRLAQMAQAQRYHFPVELWTLGDLDKNILPNTADLENLRNLVTNAIQTPPFAIFFPPILKYEALGVSGKLLSIKADYEYIWRNYTVGMGVSENMILGESGIFSSAETSSNQAFIRARKKERDQIEEWMRWNFYEPLARWNNLKIKKGNKLVPILPTFEWEKTLDYTAEEKELEMKKFLFKEGKYPTKRLLSTAAKENPEEIELELTQELGTVFDDGKRILAPDIRKKMAQGQSAEKAGAAAAGGGGAASASETAGSPVPAGGGGGGGAGAGGGGGAAAAGGEEGAAEAAPAGVETAAGGETAPAGETAELL